MQTKTAAGAVTATEGPIRTCIGCRTRAPAAELIRVVLMATHESVVVIDHQRRAPGRGAWLHPDPRCAELAQRHRAFGRALRVSGLIDAAAVMEALTATGSGAVTDAVTDAVTAP